MKTAQENKKKMRKIKRTHIKRSVIKKLRRNIGNQQGKNNQAIRAEKAPKVQI